MAITGRTDFRGAECVRCRVADLDRDPRPGGGLSVDALTRSPKRVAMAECGVVIFESRHGPGFYGELRDTYSKFHLLIAGRARWESGGRTYAVGADTLFHIAAEVPHRQADLPGQPVTLYAIHYRPELLRPELTQALSEVGMLSLDLGHSRVNEARQVRTVVQEMMFEQEAGRFGAEALLQARLTDLAVLMLRMSRGAGTAVERIDESLGRVAAYAERLKTEFYTALDLDEAARSVGLSRRRFTELFRKVTGQSWRRQVQQLRLGYAANLLATTGRSVTAIAFECGFEDLSHFHHTFKTVYGTTPLRYRSESRNGGQAGGG